MKALHRILVTGTMGGVAVLTATASGAFACTAQAGVKAEMPQQGYVAPGEVLTLTMKSFFGPDDPTASLVAVVLRAPDGSEIPVVQRPGPEFTLEWTIPPTVRSNASSMYSVVATQVRDGTRYTPPPFQLFIFGTDGGTPTTNPPVTSPPTTRSAASTTLPPLSPDGGGQQTFLEPVGGGLGSARGMVPFADGSSPAAPGRSAGLDATAGGAASATPGLGLGGGPPPPQDRPAPVLAGQPVLPADSLWSGLEGGPPPNLLDDGFRPRDGGGRPFGGILLGAGAAVLALAGLALGVSRRRLAPARH